MRSSDSLFNGQPGSSKISVTFQMTRVQKNRRTALTRRNNLPTKMLTPTLSNPPSRIAGTDRQRKSARPNAEAPGVGGPFYGSPPFNYFARLSPNNQPIVRGGQSSCAA